MDEKDIKKEEENIKDNIKNKDIGKAGKLEKKYNEEKYKEIRKNVLNALTKEAAAKKLAKTKIIEVKKKELKKDDKSLEIKNIKDKSLKINMNEIINKFKNFISKNTAKKAEDKDDKKAIEKSDKKKTHPVRMMVLSALVAIVLFVATLGVGIYFLNWHNSGLKKLAVYLPFPAGVVFGDIIKANDYWQDIDTLTHFYNYQVSLGNFKEVPSESEIKNIVWDRLVNVKLMEQLAIGYNIQITKEQVDLEVDKLVNETGNRDMLSDNLYEYYKWDIDTFIIKVIKPYLLEQRVVERLRSENDYTDQVKAKAESILQKALADPDSFAELAKEHSADVVSAQRGGDLGYFNKGVMEENFENAVFSMEIGEIKGLVESSFGYHIIKLEDKKVHEDNPEDIQVKASHILIMPLSINEIVELKKKEMKIIRFLDKKIDNAVDNNELEE